MLPFIKENGRFLLRTFDCSAYNLQKYLACSWRSYHRCNDPRYIQNAYRRNTLRYYQVHSIRQFHNFRVGLNSGRAVGEDGRKTRKQAGKIRTGNSACKGKMKEDEKAAEKAAENAKDERAGKTESREKAESKRNNTGTSEKGIGEPDLSQGYERKTFKEFMISLFKKKKDDEDYSIGGLKEGLTAVDLRKALPPDPEVSEILRPASPNKSTISCTIFDEKGDVAAVQKKFSKTEFLSENKLFPRDLRKIDSSNVDVAPIIAVRTDCILINLLHIKALIKSNEVMIFDTSNPDYASKLSLFMYDLESKLKTKMVHVPITSGKNGTDETPLSSTVNCYSNNPNQPYEFRALECILINVMAILESGLQQQSKVCKSILLQLDQEIDRAKLRDLLIHSKSLTTFCQKALLIRNALDDLLDNDDDLEDMYLTENKARREMLKSYGITTNDRDNSNGSSGSGSGANSSKLAADSTKKKPLIISKDNEMDTGEIEMLLEAYYKQCDEIVQQAETLINDIKSTEEIVNIILDANRNSLMVYELKVSIYTLGFTVATLIPALYGMNLENFLENSKFAFGSVALFSSMAGLAMIVYSLRKLQMVRKMSTVSKRSMSKIDMRVKAKLKKRLLRSRGGSNYNSKLLHTKREKQDVVWKWLVEDKYQGKRPGS